MSKDWPGQNTMSPEQLVAHYQKDSTWRHARYFYETWRKTTALVDPPKPWDETDVRMQIAMCALFVVAQEDARDSERESQ